ncbi:MAG: hypothetical protein Q8O67_09460 [Deltaproteobacteria bacterium]|nr:hypothetical protein [Deltaproteobacteria bacterium]
MAELMDPAAAAAALEGALRGLPRKAELTIADAAAKAGLALRDAERGLHVLSTRYRGTLSATDQGELLFRFPHGLSLPLTKKPWFTRAVDKVTSTIRGVGKFLVRAWVSVVLIGYAVAFIAVALALMFSGKSEDRDGGGGAAVFFAFRIIAEALFWTFHPWSPVAVNQGAWGARRRERRDARDERRGLGDEVQRRRRTVMQFGQRVVIEEDVVVEDKDVPFYERVNRFVFGPEPVKKDPAELERKLIAQIRANAGRIGLLDVMKVTGLPREEADPLMSRLLLDYEGDVDVSDAGAITYRFEALRKTAGDLEDRAPPPVWNERVQAAAVTGNSTGTNWKIAAVNAFNLVAATVALQMNLTVERIFHMIEVAQSGVLDPPILPVEGIPIVFGVIPLVFSLLLFAMPLFRRFRAAAKKEEADQQNAERAVLKTVFTTMQQAVRTGSDPGVSEEALQAVWQEATGKPADEHELTKAIVALGGDVDVDALAEGRGLYRFRDLEAEVEELKRQREEASEEEKKVGEVVFVS